MKICQFDGGGGLIPKYTLWPLEIKVSNAMKCSMSLPAIKLAVGIMAEPLYVDWKMPLEITELEVLFGCTWKDS